MKSPGPLDLDLAAFVRALARDMARQDHGMLRRGLREPEAAAYMGVGLTLFREMVADGRAPKAKRVPGSTRIVWDVRDLDAAFDGWDEQERPSEWD
jgi:predicted DNA-binding transcriptional regulator AlpA